MTSLPNSFVIALLLVILAASQHNHLKTTETGRVFSAVLYLNAASLVCIGLRWGWGMVFMLPVAAIFSTLSAILLYLAFRSFGRPGPVVATGRDRLHLIPITAVTFSAVALNPAVMEIVLVATKLVYATLLIKLARTTPHSLQLVRFSWFSNTHRALWISAGLIAFSVVIDISIAIDFALYDGRHAERLVGSVNLIVLLLLGWAAVNAGRGRAIEAVIEEVPPTHQVVGTSSDTSATGESGEIASLAQTDNDQTDDSEADDLLVLARLNSLLIDDQLFADTELNLQRLARKAGIPARTVSRVINAKTRLNLSQWVNNVRIEHACQLLKDSSITVSQAMLDSGFLTKSNFNREFKRVTGCNPSEWRRRDR